ncbi:hypothetical protein M9458_022366, partial [Cirrhinus mrigala]
DILAFLAKHWYTPPSLFAMPSITRFSLLMPFIRTLAPALILSPLRYQESSYSSEPVTLQVSDTWLPTLPFTFRGLTTTLR